VASHFGIISTPKYLFFGRLGDKNDSIRFTMEGVRFKPKKSIVQLEKCREKRQPPLRGSLDVVGGANP
jgi:hypothetical protein